MDALGVTLILALVAFLIVAPIMALVRTRLLKKNAATQRDVGQLTARIYSLEQTVARMAREIAQLRRGMAAPAEAERAPEAPPAPSRPAEAAPQPSPPIPPSAPAMPVPPAPSVLAAPPSAARPPLKSPVSAPAPVRPPRRWADMEERLGANWLNKIGTVAFVIGVALLLNYSMHYLGPAGKIVLGYAISAALLGAGIYGERRERYRVVARAVLGGGWALAYFTTYALHNIAAVRLVNSASLGFLLLFLVAAAMVAHSLRYRSQVTTGFAFLLAFASVAVSEITFGGLIASMLLAASLVIILRARRWYAIEPFAIAATYAVHLMWLDQVYARVGGHKPFLQFPASVALLTLYWAIYVVSHFLRDDRGETEQRVLTASFLLNAAGYFIVLHHQAFHPEWRFWFLLAAGAVYLGVAAFSRIFGRRLGFVLASTLGAVLIVAAIPYKYSGARLEIIWLLEAEALLLVGWRIADAHLRKLGWAASGLLAIKVLFDDLGSRFSKWRPPDAKLGWVLLALAAAYYANGELRSRLGAQATETDESASTLSPAAATGFLLAAAWLALPFLWVGLVWSLVAAALAAVGRRSGDRILRACGHGAALLAALRLLSINMFHTESWHNVSYRLLTIPISAAIFYLLARRLPVPGAGSPPPRRFVLRVASFVNRFGGLSVAYTGAATLLVALLLWREVTTAAIALAWGLFGLALSETGQSLADRALRKEGQILLLASFCRIFFADLNSTAQLGPFAARVLTVVVLAAVYYYSAFAEEKSPRIRNALLWFGTVALAALARFQIRTEWVAVGWAVMALALFALGRRFRLLTLRSQSYAMALFVGIRCAFDNFYQVGPWRFTNTRIATVAAASALLYVLFAWAQLAKWPAPPRAAESRSKGRIARLFSLAERYPQHLFFFVPTTLLTVLLSLEVRRGYLTAAWGVEGLIIFLAVLKMDERSYRWFSLLLFLLCVGRIVLVDVWNLDALGRIVSFMGLGAALLVVSFLYARHREVLRRVL